jgi:hypothetical protein
MYKDGTIIAVNGNLYEYGTIESADFTKDLQLHKVYEIDIDEDGHLVSTGITNYFTTEELTNDTMHLTKKQWYGIVEHFIRYNYNFTEEGIIDATEDIVGRCFAYGIPKIHELSDYIADYMNR